MCFNVLQCIPVQCVVTGVSQSQTGPSYTLGLPAPVPDIDNHGQILPGHRTVHCDISHTLCTVISCTHCALWYLAHTVHCDISRTLCTCAVCTDNIHWQPRSDAAETWHRTRRSLGQCGLLCWVEHRLSLCWGGVTAFHFTQYCVTFICTHWPETYLLRWYWLNENHVAARESSSYLHKGGWIAYQHHHGTYRVFFFSMFPH